MNFLTKLFVIASVGVCVLGVPLGKETKVHQISQANDAFTFKLMQSLEKSSKNLFISPFSIGTVLSMALAGSDHATYGRIYDTLGFTNSSLTKTDVVTSYNQILNSMLHNPLSKENVLSIANAIAVQKDYALLESFLNDITDSFGAHVFVEDFARGGAHKATEDINSWVKEQTREKIAKLFDDDLDRSTILVLLNAIYFKGTWKYQFNKAKTVKSTFQTTADLTSQVQMMNLKSKLNYAEFEDGSKAVELPYQNETLAMYVFLPPAGHQFSAISSTFSAEKLKDKLSHLRETSSVNVHLPHFKFEATYQLTETLRSLGMGKAFNMKLADFSKMDGRRGPGRRLYLSDVIHKTYIEVNEEGSEAAAVTGGTVRNLPSVHVPEPEFKADRPFAFFIREKATGVTLFAGVINKP